MLLQTNSYIVPSEKREEHARLMRRFRQALLRLGCDHFEVYEQVGTNWSPLKGGGRFVQFMRFRDRKHHQAVQNAERNDPAAQELIREFCQLIDFPYQVETGLFAVGCYAGAVSAGSGSDETGGHVSEGEAASLGLAPASGPDAESRDFTTADLDQEALRQAAERLGKKDANRPAGDSPTAQGSGSGA